jgi:hypothetical protein
MYRTIPPFPHMSSWHGVQLCTGYIPMAWFLIKHVDSLALPVFINFYACRLCLNIILMDR